MDLTNRDVPIRVGNNTVLYVPGDYIDASSGNEGKMYLENNSTLIINGDLVNNGSTPVFEKSMATGKVKFTGMGEQRITGTPQISFSTLEVDKATGDLILPSLVHVVTSIVLTSGNIKLNNTSVTLKESAFISGETNSKRIYGAGSISIPAISFSSGVTYTNFAGLGLSFSPEDGDFSNPTLVRHHIENSTSPFQVANGTSLLRYYSFEVPGSGSALGFDPLVFHYLDPGELGGMNEAGLRLYVSGDNGATWVKQGPAPNTSGNYVSNGVVLTQEQQNNIFVLADGECSEGNKPSDAIIINQGSPELEGNTFKVCKNETISLGSGAHYYSWTLPNGTVLANTPLVISNAGDEHDLTSYSLYVRNERGCERFRTIQIDVVPLPIAQFTHDPANGQSCFGDVVQFTDNSSAVESGLTISAWQWEFGDGAASSTAKNPSYVFSSPGKYNTELVVTNQYGCSSINTRIDDVIVHALPVPDFSFIDASATALNEACQYEPVAFTNNSTWIDYNGDEVEDPSTGMSYDWDFGDSNSSNLFEPTHHYSVHGNVIPITLTATDNIYGCSNSITKNIDVDPRPVPDFHFEVAGIEVDGTADGVCEGVDILFVNESTIADGTALTHYWTFGDGATSVEENPVHEYLYRAAPYDVTLEVTSVAYGCVYSKTLQMIIHPAPKGSFSIEVDELIIGDICAGDPAEFVNGSTIASGSMDFAWSFGDGSNSTETSAMHSFSQPRVHDILLTRTSDKGCENIVQKQLHVHAYPEVQFLAEDVCDGETVEFFNQTSVQTDAIETYNWHFGDGSSSSQVSPDHTYTSYGQYSVSLTAISTYGCVSELSRQVEVYRRPSFEPGNYVLSCNGSATIDPAADPGRYTPAGTIFSWTDSDGNFLSSSESLMVSEAGAYYVELTTMPENCSSSFSVPVFVLQQGNLGPDVSVCDNVTLDARPVSLPTSGLLSYSWEKDGTPLAETDALLSVTESGNYRVTVTYTLSSIVSEPSCSYTDEINVQIDPTPYLSLEDDVVICQGQSATLAAGVAADSYSWTKLETGVVVGTTASIDVAETGEYKLEITKGECTVFDVVAVEVLKLPQAGFLATDISVCENEEVTFTNISFASEEEDPILSFHWDFGDGSFSSLAEPGKFFDTEGEYDVALTITTENGCAASYTTKIRVDAPPVPSFSVSNGCEDVEIVFTNESESEGSVSYEWDFGDGGSSSDPEPTHIFNAPGFYDVTLVASAGACTRDITNEIKVYQAPVVDLGESTTSCGNQLIMDAGEGAESYRWYDVQAGNTVSASRYFTVTEDMELGLEVTSVHGCSRSDETTIALNTPVVIELGEDREVCGPLTLDAGNFPSGLYAWNTGETSRYVQATSSGTYQVRVVDQNGCAGEAQVHLTISPVPSVALGADKTACDGSAVVLDAGSSADSFLWSTGETSKSVSVTENGTYSVVAFLGGCSATDEVEVNFLASPKPDFSVGGQCEGDVLAFTSSEQNGATDVSYLWSFGDGTQSVAENPSKTFSTAGTYSVLLTMANDLGCQSSVVKQVAVHSSPKPNFSFTNACEGQELGFTNTTVFLGNEEDLSYEWNFGDGAGSTDVSPSHAYMTEGTYSVVLTAWSEFSCSRSRTKVLSVKSTPAIDLGGIIETCEAGVVLDAGNVGSTYRWSDNSDNRMYLADRSGEYAVRVTSPTGCFASDTVMVVLLESAKPQLGPDRDACGELLLDPEVVAASYLWSTGATTRNLAATTSGLYWVQTISSALCVNRDSITATIHAVPEVDLGPNLEVCRDEPVTLDATTDIAVSYLWNTGARVPVIEPVSTGKYSVMLTSSKGCTYTEEIEVTINELPPLDFEDTYEACGSLSLGVNNIRSEFLWSTGSTTRNEEIKASGSYWLRITDRKGCVSTDTTVVVVRTLPELDLGNDLELCFGETFQLDPGPHVSYFWNDNSTSRFKEVGATGNYFVTVTDEFGCQQSDAISVFVKPSLGLSLPSESIICSLDAFFLDAGVENVEYSWVSDNGFSSTDRVIYPGNPGNYTITVTSPDGCSESATVETFETTEKIEASFLIPSTVAVNEEVNFIQLTEPEPLSFKWTFGNGITTSKTYNPSYIYYTPGEYTITLTVSNGVCSDTETKLLLVEEVKPGEQAAGRVKLVEFLKANLYPNPSSDRVNLDIEMSEEAAVTVNIFNLRGFKIAEFSFEGSSELLEFDLTNVLAGTYVMVIQSGIVSKTIRFVKSF